ncbi:MAG: glutamine--fructose-6-phosphate transaminase (isomerizing) [Nitrosopumilus sp.]|nr:glutamine--fructose-6-phosphate transaminase (isomerizing) [Nitrosopumilus sp.]MDH3487644.1 glutamine--fructose-6-phosphate transaminase (isomerizing) [Nitrosopumilus sp.]
MCSIIGYASSEQVTSTLLKGLKKMEYRGYDSAGIAVASNNQLLVQKEIGRVKDLEQKLDLKYTTGHAGIGHTRWATHGGVSKINAHPHMCNDESIGVVHNGIIENYDELKNKLIARGYSFKSKTDTEIIPNLLSYHFNQTNDIKQSIIKTVYELKGNYSFIALIRNETMVAVKHHEPLILGIENDGKGYVLASDILGFTEKTEDIIDMDNNQFAIILSNGFKMYDFKGNTSSYLISKLPQKHKEVNKENFEHFTLKEINEQPATIVSTGNENEQTIDAFTKSIRKKENIVITGSGTSYYAGLMARYLFPMFINNAINVIKSSEMKFSEHFLNPSSILVAISQSGESADVLEAISIAKNRGLSITSVVNVMRSTLAKESDYAIGLNCGSEIGVAATKSFTSQLAIFYKIADKLSEGKIGLNFNEISQAMSKIIKEDDKVKKISKELKNVHDIYVLGRGIHYPIAMEGALKIKEITYIHAEGMSAGELKHGPLALMDKSAFVIILNPEGDTYQDNLSSIHEIKARGAKIIGISNKNNENYDYFIEIPKISEILYPLIEVIPLQQLAYYTSLEKGLDPDYPRNLAKCVTVK